MFDFSNTSDIVIDNIWNEHMVCLYWGANTDRMTIRNSRIRNMFADGINMTNGSTDNLVSNNDARATGDDSFALFSAIDAGGADMKNNLYENLTTTLTWRAAGLAVYGGYGNTFRNIHIADTLVYSGITISSLDFGYPMNGFGTDPTTFENVSIVRAGGHFWGGQTFPGIWVFSASKVFQESGSTTSTSSTRPTAASCSRRTTSGASRSSRLPHDLHRTAPHHRPPAHRGHGTRRRRPPLRPDPGHRSPAQRLLFEPELVVRGSTAQVAAQ
ncbi:hypothetical protein STENM223S_03539 [Streptomyces tendae]